MSPMSHKLSITPIVVALTALGVVTSEVSAATAVSPENIAVSLFEYSASTGSALYEMVSADNKQRIPGDYYQNIAYAVAKEIQSGKVSSSIVQGPFKLASDLLTIGAIADPEPQTKIIATLAAYGSRKFGEAAGQSIYDAAQNRAVEILARALKESNVTAAELDGLSAEQFSKMVDNLSIGNIKMREILKGQNQAMEMLKTHAEDFVGKTSAAALLQAKRTASDVEQIKKRLVEDGNNLEAFHKDTKDALDKIEVGLNVLKKNAEQANEDLVDLRKEIGTNTRSLQSLAQISSMSWSTSQKISALDNGFFPEMTENERAATKKSLESQFRVETAISELQLTGHYLESINEIGKNLGVDGNVIKVLGDGQKAANAITKLVAGDYLGGVAALSGFFGAAAPDASEQRHQKLMEYLEKKFEQINQKLEDVIKLQRQTISALNTISAQLVEIEDKLKNVERVVVMNRAALQYLVRDEWQACDAMIGLNNHQYKLRSLDKYINQLSMGHFVLCYKQFTEFFDARVSGSDWAGSILSNAMFPDKLKVISENANEEAYYARLGTQSIEAYQSARRFFITYFSDGNISPTRHLIGVSDPRANLSDSAARDNLIDAHKGKLDSFTCNQDYMSDGLRFLICQGITPGAKEKPKYGYWQMVISDAPIGPLVGELVDTGIMLSELSDFLYIDHGNYYSINSEDLKAVGKTGVNQTMRKALGQRRGVDLLRKLDWLAQSYVLQQSVTYGDITSKAIADVLFDNDKNALRIEAVSGNLTQQLALDAMKANPVLARNVVMIAVRRALSTTVHLSDDNIDTVSVTYYALGMRNYSGASACLDDPIAKQVLVDALKNWNLAFRAEKEELRVGSQLEKCKERDKNIDIGSGLVAIFKDFEVKMPSPRSVESGEFEYPASLRLALAYKEKISEAKALRQVGSMIKDYPEISKGQLARGLMESGCLSGVCR